MVFKAFRAKMQQHMTDMLKDTNNLFEVEIDKDQLWNLYLDSFPAGTNEIFRKRREHDCSYCKHFIKNIGNMVVIKDNKVTTIWDFDAGNNTFQPVVDALAAFIKKHAVTNVYVSKNSVIGTEKNFEDTPEHVYEWNHLCFTLPKQFVDRTGKSEGEIKGEFRAVRDVFKRSLDEISAESVETVLDLIAQNSLYKGEEWKNVLTEFLKHKKVYAKLTKESDKDN
jgi:hypothetical protein